MRFNLDLIGILLFAFIGCVLYMYFFMNMSISQAVNRIFNTITRSVSSVQVDVPPHLSHTPSQAADAQLERVNNRL